MDSRSQTLVTVPDATLRSQLTVAARLWLVMAIEKFRQVVGASVPWATVER